MSEIEVTNVVGEAVLYKVFTNSNSSCHFANFLALLAIPVMYNAEDILGYIKLCLYCWEWHSRPQGPNTTPDAGIFLIVNLCTRQPAVL